MMLYVPASTFCRPVVLLGGFVGVLLTLGSGCGSRGPAVEYVEGVVMLDGTPLADADVGFSPISSGQGLAAAGRTGVDGSFRLNAQGAKPGQGTATGEYVVTVRKVATSASLGPTSTDDPNYGKTVPDISGRDDQVKWLVPENYGNAKTSPLKATVEPGKNSFRFEVVSGGKPTR